MRENLWQVAGLRLAGLLAAGGLAGGQNAQAQAFSMRYLVLPPFSGQVRPITCTEAMPVIMTKLGWKVVNKSVTAETGTLIMNAGNGVYVTAFCSVQSRHIYLSAVNPTRNDNSPELALDKFVREGH